MISNFIISCLFYLFATASLVIVGAFGGLMASVIPMLIHENLMDNCRDSVRDAFFAICCVLLPVIFGCMCAWTAYDLTNRNNPQVDETPVLVQKTEVHRIKLLYLRPPKHVYVDFEDLNTGVASSNVYVSKHCNNYAQNKGGDEYNVEVIYKSKGDKTWIEYQNLYNTFCG